MSRQNPVEVQQSQHGGGRLWREDEYEGLSHGVQSIMHGCDRALQGLEWLENALSNSSGDSAVVGQGGTDTPPPQSKSRHEWGTGPPAAASTSRQVVSTGVSLSKESSDSAPSAPSTVNTNDHYNGKSSGESGCGLTSLRPSGCGCGSALGGTGSVRPRFWALPARGADGWWDSP